MREDASRLSSRLPFMVSHAILDNARKRYSCRAETKSWQEKSPAGCTNMKILVIHGPNLNLLGKRDPTKYGTVTMTDINSQLQLLAADLACELEFFQSNHEGAIIDFLQLESSRAADGVIINPGALVRYGYSLRQALVDLAKPVIEVHMSDIHKTGVNTAVNVLEDIRLDQIVGLKEQSYYEALDALVSFLRTN
jgi:3-dehydroquinate dehydratase-2